MLKNAKSNYNGETSEPPDLIILPLHFLQQLNNLLILILSDFIGQCSNINASDYSKP